MVGQGHTQKVSVSPTSAYDQKLSMYLLIFKKKQGPSLCCWNLKEEELAGEKKKSNSVSATTKMYIGLTEIQA